MIDWTSYLTSGTCLLLLALATVGCRDEPDREWANEIYMQKKATIDKVESELKAAYTTFNPVPFEKMPSDPAERKTVQEAQNTRQANFDAKAMSIFKANPDIIGWEMTYSFPKKGETKPIRFSFEEASRHLPSYRVGALRADKRPEKVDDRSLSWGLYQIKGKEKKKQLGMDVPSYHKGIEVDFEIPQEDSRLDVSLFIAPKKD